MLLTLTNLQLNLDTSLLSLLSKFGRIIRKSLIAYGIVVLILKYKWREDDWNVLRSHGQSGRWKHIVTEGKKCCASGTTYHQH
jgi:hypothetical protein